MKLPESVLAVSPHLDDVVFSCGELVAQVSEVLVVTTFAGIPNKADTLTEWDRCCGFSDARHAVLSRREEDRNAMRVLSAEPLWLDFLDSQYGPSPAPDTLAEAFSRLIDDVRPEAILIPAGLFHSDHVLVHQAMLLARSFFCEKTWWVYEDALYRRVPALLQNRLAALLHDGIQMTPVTLVEGGNLALKRDAVRCYASQLRALERKAEGVYADIFAPERYWYLEATPATNTIANP